MTPPLHLARKTPPGGPSDAGTSRADRVRALNARFRHHGATAVLQGVLRDGLAGTIAMVSSFGADSVALLHLVALADPSTPVLFIETGMHFPETLAYQMEVAERLRLRNVRLVRADDATVAQADPYGALRLRDPDACCALRKTAPLENALAGFDGWITGRKRYQAGTRAALEFFEIEAGTDRIKVNPLAHWTPQDVADYMAENRLPRHPLIARGYPSVGCAPCTSPVAPGEDARAGRWRGQAKTECGIHFAGGTAHRASDQPA